MFILNQIIITAILVLSIIKIFLLIKNFKRNVQIAASYTWLYPASFFIIFLTLNLLLTSFNFFLFPMNLFFFKNILIYSYLLAICFGSLYYIRYFKFFAEESGRKIFTGIMILVIYLLGMVVFGVISHNQSTELINKDPHLGQSFYHFFQTPMGPFYTLFIVFPFLCMILILKTWVHEKSKNIIFIGGPFNYTMATFSFIILLNTASHLIEMMFFIFILLAEIFIFHEVIKDSKKR